MTFKKKYVTTPIFYPNAIDAHIGHLYSVTLASVWQKANKLINQEILFLSGMDEHGQKVEQAAKKKGQDLQEYVNEISASFQNSLTSFDVDFDIWHRTTSEKHKKCVQHVWKVLLEKNLIYKGAYNGWYSISDENYLTASEYEQSDKKNIIWKEEECYFFKLSFFQERLLEYFSNNQLIFPFVKQNEVLGFLKKGLNDFSVSRPKDRFSWGIDVPEDDGQIVYVWIDALCNYLSALNFPEKEYEKFWPAVHVIGKDILKFHAIYWVAMLMALDVELPKAIVVHGWLLNCGNKISKSLNNFIALKDLRETSCASCVKFYLLHSIPLGEDCNFSEDGIKKYNNLLANKFGNLAMRIVGIVVSKGAGKLELDFNYENEELNEAYLNFYNKYLAFVENITVYNDYLVAFLALLDQMNNFVQAETLWANYCGLKLTYLLNLLKKIIILISPILSEECLSLAKFFEFEICFNELNENLKKTVYEPIACVFKKQPIA